MRSYKESMNQIVMPDALKERIRRQVAPDARQAAPDAWQARRVHRRWYTVCANMAACLLLLLCTQMRLSDFLIPVQDAPANSIETASSTLPQTADTAEPPIDSAPKRASAYHNSAAVSPHLPEPAESAAADSAVFRSPAVSVYGSDTTPESGSFPADMAATAVESGNKPLSKETAETTDAPDTQKKSTQTTGLDSPPLLQSPPLSSSSAGGTVNGTGFTESIPATDASSATLPQTEQKPPAVGSGGGGGLPNELYSAREFTSLADLRSVCGFVFRAPTVLPEGCTLSDISLLWGDTVQLTYDGAMPFTFRVASGTGDISGDYNDYDETAVQTVGTLSVSLRGNAGLVYTATWQEENVSYALLTDGLPQEKLLSLIAGMQ